jgi:TPR repeat protein
MRHALRLLIAAGLLTTAANAADYDAAMAAFDRGDYAVALPTIRMLAEGGYAPAQNTLGVMLDQGLGTDANLTTAIAWFRQTAAQGDAKAQANLGVLYEHGRGVARDRAEAVRWYTLAAAQGRAVAENNLGAILAEGQDLVQAYVLFDRAARHYPAEVDRIAAAANRDVIARRMTASELERARQDLADPENQRQ